MDHMPHETALVVLSGGQDSTTCLYQALYTHAHVHAVTFDYGQRHRVEIEAARRIAYLAGVDSHEVIEVPRDLCKSTSPLVSNAALEQYEDAQHLPGGIEKTFVPMRNQFFLTIAANRAVALGARYIYTGVSCEDYGGYPDCRPGFIRLLWQTINASLEGTGHKMEIVTPLMNLSKADTVRLALDIPNCWEALAWSHTAYDGKYPPTGKDHASLLRAKGFEEAGVPDPLVMRAAGEDKMNYPRTPNYSTEVVKDYAWRAVKAVRDPYRGCLSPLRGSKA